MCCNVEMNEAQEEYAAKMHEIRDECIQEAFGK